MKNNQIIGKQYNKCKSSEKNKKTQNKNNTLVNKREKKINP